MIGYINGLIIDKDEKWLLVLAQNIGYKVFTTTDLAANAKVDSKIQLYIHTAVREDDISLYGFSSKEELQFYEQLLGVSGVGPKVALDILTTPIHLTQSAIINSDTGLLTKIKGLGKKTAERIILELKNKIIPSTTKDGKPAISHVNEDAVLALESLGYEKFQIIKAMVDLPSDITETEDIVKYFLKTSS
ncbi:Holliday junction branch migration protein RuvA [Patescibacteria group bacterium]|nr:Holliday junction branch migration protein RuvA [Patescibacteria group bacterium]MBU1683817.1 Holliday junction branch migration protein RuvA [Patescibacteria group bacterium]MBU1935214.1 Holliday junction branch migration protein RuvA [Patescibacteria group bacterium]